MTLFRFPILPGQSIFDQVVYAAKKAIISGELSQGQAFPSVRALAVELKIHPNTAHRVVQHLIQEGWLESRPGIGTTVAEPPTASAAERKRLLVRDVEQLVVEARRVGLDVEDIMEAIQTQWYKLQKRELVRK